jgi:hypothetical protein
MQTTLRIDDQLYREAKTEAAREGITLTRFLEDSIRSRLEQSSPSIAGEWNLRVCDGMDKFPSLDKMKEILENDQLDYDLHKIEES